jgi:hypothetical protein
MRIPAPVPLLVASRVVCDSFPVDVDVGVDDERAAVGADDEPGRANSAPWDGAAGTKL